MWRERVTNLTNNSIYDIIQKHKIILLYPQTTYRTLFLSTFLNMPDYRLIYCRVPENGSLQDVMSSLLDQTRTIHPDFGEHTLKLLQKGVSSVELAESCISDLATFESQVMLYIDEFDRINWDDKSSTFFAHLADRLPDAVKFAISGRQLTLNPWQKFVLNGDAAVLGTAFHDNQLMFNTDQTNKPQLEIYAFGGGQAIVDGVPVTTWDGALPRNLFFYFIDNNLVTRDQIFNVFWPKLEVKEATNVFHVTKRKITERISLNVADGGNYEITSYKAGFYTPSDKVTRHYDVAMFEESIEAASDEFDDEKAAELYRRAIEIYKAPFLLSIDMPWVNERREKLRQLFVEALIGLARIHKAADEVEDALGYFMRALREMPEREDIHREVMLLYRQMGRTDDALRQYEYLTRVLQKRLKVTPGPETRNLFEEMTH